MGSDLDERYPLHHSVFLGDTTFVKQSLQRDSEELVNSYDSNGNTPLILALHFHKTSIVELLLKNGADPNLESKSGWSPLQVAIASGVPLQIVLVYNYQKRKMREEFPNKMEKIISSLRNLPDFYIEIAWEFSSWLPFVTRYIPSDTYKITKKGSNLRIDSTVKGLKNHKWIRGDLSIIFTGQNDTSSGNIFFIDHSHQKVENVIDALNSNDPSQTKYDLKHLCKQELLTTSVNLSSIKFEVQTNWKGVSKEYKTNGFNCKLFTIEGLKWNASHRIFESSPHKVGTLRNHSIGDTLSTTWSEYIKTPLVDGEGKYAPLIYKNEELRHKEKVFKGSMYITKEFPRKIKDYMPLLEAIAPSRKQYEDLERFIELKIPNEGFPVRIELPVFPTVVGLIHFKEYKEGHEIDDNTFVIPKEYKIRTSQ